jgi:hypothetical protein
LDAALVNATIDHDSMARITPEKRAALDFWDFAWIVRIADRPL